ncbi:MAG TPA: hypothetical protein PLI18_08700 [Pirellulaceae bacterium]|nr:hypothetical protein [Pirellulaceae bacterium]
MTSSDLTDRTESVDNSDDAHPASRGVSVGLAGRDWGFDADRVDADRST